MRDWFSRVNMFGFLSVVWTSAKTRENNWDQSVKKMHFKSVILTYACMHGSLTAVFALRPSVLIVNANRFSLTADFQWMWHLSLPLIVTALCSISSHTHTLMFNVSNNKLFLCVFFYILPSFNDCHTHPFCQSTNVILCPGRGQFQRLQPQYLTDTSAAVA